MAEELTNNFFDVVEDIFKKYEIVNKGKELNKDLKTGTTLMSHSDFVPELASKYNLTEKETEDLIMIILDNQVIDDDIPYMVSRNTFKDGSNVADSVKKYIDGEKIIIDKTNYFHPQHKIFGGTYQRKLPDTPTNVVDDKLKRINEILEQGIKATGIDIDPTDTTKYGFAPEHGILTLEIENLGLLDELQELVGGEDKLGELIQAIAFKQEEVSPRYQTQEFQNFDLEGEPIGKRAYGITTAELQQKEIQDLIKNFTDTPTNVVDDVKTLDIENYKPITIEALEDAGLHARPASELVASFNNQGIPITILKDGKLKKVEMIGLLQEGTLKGETLDIYIPKDANINLDNVSGIKVVPTPTNVVDDVTLVKHTKTGKDVVLSLDENGNVILYRSTDDPYRIINSDFPERQTLPFSSTGSRGFGNNSYFASSPTYSFTYELTEAIGGGKTTQNYKYVTNIKVNEILPLQQKISDTPELAKVLGVPETYYNSRGGVNRTWQNLLYSPDVLEEMGYDKNLQGKDWLQDNIDTFKENGIKAIGNDSTGRGSPNANYTEYEIIPLVKDEDIYDIKPVSVLENTTSTNPPKKELKFTETPLDTPGGSLGAAKLNDQLVFDSWVDNYAKTTTSFVDNLPLSTTVKNQFNNLVQGRARNLATPGGVADAVDVWELGVLGLMIAAVAYKEYDEIPTILTNKAVDMFNNMTSFYGIPPVSKEEYDLDYEFINKVVETGEKFMPTDIILKKVGDVTKGAAETGAVTGFGYVPPNPTKTDTMETTQKIQPGVQEEKMFKKAKPQKGSGAGSGVKIL